MEEVGVEAVVKGLNAFISDSNKINNALQGIRGEGTFLQRAFASVTDGIVGFGESVVRIAEVALGVLLRDAIRAAVDAIKELISATIDAGNEFQTLEIRLQRLNFNSLIEGGTEYNQAAEQSIKLTQEQIKWLTLLAAKSPYDATDVANVYTLARSYSFADDQARGLTDDILNFASGMGLGNAEIQRIIVNLGQMVQQGKTTQRELNDLARGAFVPVNDVLKIMSEQTGVAMEDMDDFRKTGESVDAFMKAFSTLVEQRFQGATEQMSNTFKAAADNVLDLVKATGGLNIVKPILDSIGKSIANFANAFTDDPARWDRLQRAAQKIGRQLALVVEDLFNLLPGTEGLADAVIRAVQNVGNWIQIHRKDITDFFIGIGDTIKNKIVPFFTDKLIPMFQKWGQWFEDNRNVITLFFQAIRDIFSEFISDLLGGQGPAKDFGDTITRIMWFVVENKDAILKWLEILWSVFAVWQVISTVLSIAMGIIISIAGYVLSLVVAFSGLIGVVEFVAPLFIGIGTALGGLLTVIGAITAPVWALIAAFAALVILIALNKDKLATIFSQLWFIIQYYWDLMVQKVGQAGTDMANWMNQNWSRIHANVLSWWLNIKNTFTQKIEEIKASFTNINWVQVGSWIVQGLAQGIAGSAGVIASAARSAAKAAYTAATSYLGIHSPSTLFFDIGAQTMAGMAQGIQQAAGLAAGTMAAAVTQVAAVAAPSVTNSTTINYNNTLNLQSSAPTEPIIQDFNMLSSLAGV